MPKAKLSVVIVSWNMGESLERVLKSVQFADEIVMVDVESTDNSVAIAKKYTKHVFSKKRDYDFVEPYRNFAISKASHDWILVIDTDEVIPKPLQAKIREIIDNPTADAYFLPRQNLIFGKWITKAGWWPDYQLRLFKKGSVTWQNEIHSVPEVKGETFKLPAEEDNAILHYNYDSITQFIDKLNNYTSVQAEQRQQKSPQDDFTSEQLFANFRDELMSRALVRDGVGDGLHGNALSLLQAMSEAVVYLKQWEATGFPEDDQADFGAILQQLQKIWCYWWADYQVRNTRGLTKIYWQIRRKFKL